MWPDAGGFGDDRGLFFFECQVGFLVTAQQEEHGNPGKDSYGPCHTLPSNLFFEQASSEYQGQKEQDYKYKKQEFCDGGSTCRNACKSEQRSYERYYKECQ